jgi:hypothetical protein
LSWIRRRSAIGIHRSTLLSVALALTVSGCASGTGAFMPPDPGPVATENFQGEIVWGVTKVPWESVEEIAQAELTSRQAARRSSVYAGSGANDWVQLTLLTRGEAALGLEFRRDTPTPIRGKFSRGENQPLAKIDYVAGTYREAGIIPEDDMSPAQRQRTDEELTLRETNDQRMILGYLCTATDFYPHGGAKPTRVWATRGLKVNKAPLNFITEGFGPIGLMIASVRGVPLLIEQPQRLRMEVVSITAKPVDPLMFAPPGATYRLVE